eukprot:6210837-Pleurochrysis_carterae.AAC.2
MEGAQAVARALKPSRVNRALCARKKWYIKCIHVQKCANLHAMSALDAMMDICVCRERSLRRRVRHNCAGAHVHAWMLTFRCQSSKLFLARASEQKAKLLRSRRRRTSESWIKLPNSRARRAMK